MASPEGLRRLALRIVAAGLLATAPMTTVASESAPSTLPVPAEPRRSEDESAGRQGDPVSESSAEGAVEPWQIEPSQLGTQRLFRVRYGGPEGEGSVRLTLKLLTPRRYRVSTVDLLGRPVWSLAVEGDEVTWIDDRQRRFCRFQGQLTPSSVPLAPFSLPALPALLLGRLPESPVGAISQAPGGRVEFNDAGGHRWSVDLHAGTVLGWTRWTQGEPSAWWRLIDGEGVLSERDRGMQIRWRQVLSEPIVDLPPQPTVPPEYGNECAGLLPPAPSASQHPPH